MPYQNGLQNVKAASQLPWLVKYGPDPLIADRHIIDDARPNNWLEYEDNATGTARIHYLIGVDPNNLTQLANPNGVNALALSIQQLATPAAPTITTAGTAGSTTWTYVVVAKSGFGQTLGYTPASSGGSTTSGNATLTSANYNIITFSKVSGATAYDIYRTVAGSSPTSTGKIGTVTATVDPVTGIQTATYAFNDTAIAGDGTTAPTTNTTGTISVPEIVGDLGTVALATPVNVAVAVNGTAGSTSYDYEIVARSYLGTTPASSAGTTSTGNATLSATNSLTITWNPVAGAVSYDVYRTVGGSTQGKIGNVLSTVGTTFTDTGLAATGSAPTTNSTGQANVAVGPNYVATEGGANNAITFNLVDASGQNVPLSPGLRVVVQLAHSLQAGANTAAMNGGSAKSIFSHRTGTSGNIATAYTSTGCIDMVYNGSNWMDMSQ
jgi:hypothetical protein